jgi:hypothetical protein
MEKNKMKKSIHRDSNLQPSVHKSNALNLLASGLSEQQEENSKISPRLALL